MLALLSTKKKNSTKLNKQPNGTVLPCTLRDSQAGIAGPQTKTEDRIVPEPTLWNIISAGWVRLVGLRSIDPDLGGEVVVGNPRKPPKN